MDIGCSTSEGDGSVWSNRSRRTASPVLMMDNNKEAVTQLVKYNTFTSDRK